MTPLRLLLLADVAAVFVALVVVVSWAAGSVYLRVTGAR